MTGELDSGGPGAIAPGPPPTPRKAVGPKKPRFAKWSLADACYPSRAQIAARSSCPRQFPFAAGLRRPRRFLELAPVPGGGVRQAGEGARQGRGFEER